MEKKEEDYQLRSDNSFSVPYEVISHIIGFVSSPLDVCACTQVCHKWYKATQTNIAWQSAFNTRKKEVLKTSQYIVERVQPYTWGKSTSIPTPKYTFERIASYEYIMKPSIVINDTAATFSHFWQSRIIKVDKDLHEKILKKKSTIDNHKYRNRGDKIIPYRSLVKNKRSMLPIDCKIVLMGNVDVGKTSFLRRYVSGKYSEEVPEIFKSSKGLVYHGNEIVHLNLWDTEMWDTSFNFKMEFDSSRYLNVEFPDPLLNIGGEDYSSFRNLTYSQTDIFLFCFALDDPISLEYVKNKWVPEVRRWAPPTGYVFVLVGMKSDRERKVERTDALRVAKDIKATSYVECSSKTGENVDVVMMACLDTAFENLRLVELTKDTKIITDKGHGFYKYKYLKHKEKGYVQSTDVVERGFNIDMKRKYPRARDDLGRNFTGIENLIQGYIDSSLKYNGYTYSYV